MLMNPLRVLLVDGDRDELERISSALAGANHTVLPAAGFKEASEALYVERFDAVLLARPVPDAGLAEFTAKLRELDRSQRNSVRTPVLSIGGQITDVSSWSASRDAKVDGYLAERFEPAALTSAVENLARSVSKEPQPPSEAGPLDLPVLEPEKFREQVGYEDELMIEVIDLFLAECQQELPEMAEALARGDFSRLARIAHTIKGSLGSIHAPLARWRAQALETAAKERNSQLCQELLGVFERELDYLLPQLLALRDSRK
jgi:two-component system, sensor histidine kinase and response regulator